MNTSDDLTLAGLVHDLNNVFQTMVDAADMLSEDARHAKLSAAILRSVERGKHIAESIRTESQRGARANTPFEQILANAIAFVEDSQITGRSPAIRFETQIEPGIRLGGNWAWERVLINLFLNSMRAMPQGGAIGVRARRTSGRIEIAVTDEGSGIAPEVADNLFQPHVSGSSSTGLGLHIVDTIVRQDGGRIRASNREGGVGAEFVISLPVPSAARA